MFNLSELLKLYLVTDPDLTVGRSIFTIVEQALTGGVTIIQLRNKEASTQEFLQQARQLKIITNKYNVPLIINDRVDIALKINATGVHLGQDDMLLEQARKELGDEKIIGISVSSAEEAKTAQEQGANYIAIGPVFLTQTKKDLPKPLGLEKTKKIIKSVSIPTVAIGSINLSNVEQVAKTGVDGIAVVTALTLAKNVKKMAKDLREKFIKDSFIRR